MCIRDRHLIPTFQPLVDGGYQSARRKNSTQGTGVAARAVVSQQGKAYALNKAGGKSAGPGKAQAQARDPGGDVRLRSSQPKPGRMLTQHTGLPPRPGVGGSAGAAGAGRKAAPGGRKPR